MLSEKSKKKKSRGVKSDSSRLVRSEPSSGDCLITLSWLPHTVTAGKGRSGQALDGDSTRSWANTTWSRDLR